MDGPDYERQHWQQINDLFVAAQARPLEERRAFLKQACADQPDLQAEVESLLFAYDASDDFLHKINLDEAVALLESVGEPVSPGQQIGPYRVVRELGRGGMGAVYLAHRADGQFDQQVALKLIKRGIDSEAILYRFLHERQILARLQHAHIARLLDGGVSADGRPYFAMEYVAGVPLTDYCDAHRLDVEARLRLFEQVCRAVHYAHTNLVVHRDLKPSNMLVTEEGELKLLDFGIAKLLDEEASVKTMTEAGLRVMTPEYAAPEQMQGETVTTATDIYALGVVLYELLTGHRPYQFDRRTPAAVAHVMAEAEPVRPSTVVSQTTELRFGDGMGTTKTITPQDVSQARSTQPERLQRRLRGDLDIVVLKALRKEPERRYASAEALVEDIRRHLAGLPVVAQQDTMDYRMRKFVRRHRVGVLAAGLVVAALVAGLTVALWQARVARQEATKAEVVQAFMLSLFKTSNPDKAKGETITARELLDAGATRVEVELANQPEVQAEMMAVVGKVYQQLGLYEPARPLLEQALARRRAVLGENHEDVAASLHDLASLLQSTGDYAAAESLYRETLTLQRKLLGHQHTTVATTLNNLASLLFDQGDYDAAEGLFREALALRQKLLGPEHPDIAISLNDLALVLYYNGDYDAAEPLFYEALAMQRKLLGPEHTDLAMTLNNLALLLQSKRDYDAAEPLLREALAIKRKLLGPEHPSLATTLGNLGLLLRRKRDYTDAEPLYRETLAIQRKLLGPEHPDVATTLNNLAVLLREQGDYDTAEPLFWETLAMKRKLLGEEHPSVASSLSGLAALLHEKGDYDAAEAHYREALAMRKKLLGEHPRVATTRNRLAATLIKQGDYTAAESLYSEALTMQRKLLNKGHPDIATSLAGLGEVTLLQEHPEDAEPLLREAFAMREQGVLPGNADHATVQSLLGACLSALGRYDEAEPLLLTGYETLQASQGEQEATQQARRHLAAHYERQGRSEQARIYQQAATEN